MDYELNKQRINDWYEAYSNDIYKFILYMIHDHEQSKDLMQDTFIKAYNHLHSFRDGNEKGWLFTLARNITIDYLRKKKPLQYITGSTLSIPSRERSPEQTLSMNEQEEELYIAISKLKRSYREVIILRKIKEFSIKETASILGWSESKVKTILWRGMNSLKTQLEKEGYRHESV